MHLSLHQRQEDALKWMDWTEHENPVTDKICCRQCVVLYVCDLLTSVCTIAGLCVLSIFTVWKMSTTPSYLIRSKTMLRVMKTPVRPTPALSKEKAQSSQRCTEMMLHISGHGSCESEYCVGRFCVDRDILSVHLCCWLLTYSGPRSVHLGQTALLFYGLGRWSRWILLLTLALLVRASPWTETALLSVTAHPV